MDVEKLLILSLPFIVDIFRSSSDAHVVCTVNGISYTCTNISINTYFPLVLPENIQQVTIDGSNTAELSLTSGLFKHESWTNVSELSILEFSNAKFIERDFLDGLEKLKFLSISACPALMTIDPDAFQYTPDIEALHLDENYNLKLSQVEATLTGRLNKLKYLSLIGIQATKTRVVLGERFSKALHSKNLTNLIISRVKLLYIEHDSVLKTLAALKYLNLSFSSILLATNIQFTHTGIVSNRLELLDLTGCPMIVQYGLKKRDAIITRSILENIPYLFLQSITYYSNQLKINVRLINEHNITSSLKIWDFSQNNIIILNITFAGAYYLNALEALNLASNNMEYISPSFLSNLPSIKILDLSNNQLHIMQTSQDFPNIFSKNKDLEIIYLKNNKLSVVPSTLFSSNTKLRVIDLSDNELVYFNVELRNALDLRLTDLRNNHLKTLPAVFLEQVEQIFRHQPTANTQEATKTNILLRQLRDKNLIADKYNYGYKASKIVQLAEKHSVIPQHLMINILDNPIVCDCDTLDFVKWVIVTDIVISNRTNARCSYGNKEEFLNKETHEMIKENCRLLYMIGLVTGSLVAVVLCIFTFTAIIILWHKWTQQNQGLENLRREILQDNINFKYVVFLSYCSQDVHIVDEHILPSLNRILKEKLNTEKDLVCTGADSFVPGMLIIDEIHRCINESLVVIPVITPAFLRSRWSLKECVDALEKQRPVVVLMKQNTNTNDTVGAIKQLIANYTRATWSDNEGQFLIHPSWYFVGEAIIRRASETFINYRSQSVNTPNELIPLVNRT
ncbi:hypothetical protein ACJMK2_000690 [Sinanodonta woodiana]|uniref:TIR domain-containing protein n=1 Tax=Sinanodonta woodiana TaxID=1069815 RepID=A0ABD3XQ84_SINWO